MGKPCLEYGLREDREQTGESAQGIGDLHLRSSLLGPRNRSRDLHIGCLERMIAQSEEATMFGRRV